MTFGRIRILAISIVCVLCAGLADSASAAPQARTVSYAFCFTGPIQSPVGGPSVRYLSGIFLIDTAPYYAETHRSSLDQSAPFVFPWVMQFDQFIARTNPHAGGSDCQGFPTIEDTQKKIDFVKLGDSNNKMQDVETGWKYVANPPIAPPPPPSQPVAAAPVPPAQPATPARAAAAPSAPARPAASAVAPAQTPYAVCWGETTGTGISPTAYFGVPFDGTVKNTPAWTKSFRDALNSKYGRASAGPLHCNTFKSLDEARQHIQTTEDSLRATHTIVDTGWKF